MQKPRSGWPKYKRSHNINSDKNTIDHSKISYVFFAWGVFGLLTSWYFNNFLDKKEYSFNPYAMHEKASAQKNNSFEITTVEAKPNPSFLGPIRVTKPMEVFEISIKAQTPRQSWSFIQGEVLNSNHEYLFAFGKELWHETGYDSDGSWTDSQNEYDMRITFPETGLYYLNFKIEGNKLLNHVGVTISKKRGSALPHFWFGIISIFIGFIINGMIRNLWEAFD